MTGPGFENGGVGWQKTSFGGRSIVTSEAHTGTHSQQMVVSSSFPRQVYQDVNVTGGNTYDASVWIKAAGLNVNGSSAELLWLNATGLPDELAPGNLLRTDMLGSLGGTSGWTQVSLNNLVAPAVAVVARLSLLLGTEPDGSGTAWFDDASFIETASSMPTQTPTPPPTATLVPTSTATPSSTPTPVVSVGGAAGNVGQTVSVDVVLGSVSNGISGFAFDLSVQNAAVARIQNVTLPEYGFQIVTGAPGSTVRVFVADGNEILQDQITSAVIATMDLDLLMSGTSQLTLTLSQLDSDLDGGDLLPITLVVSGSVTVN